MSKTIELTDYEAKILWLACNNSQSELIRFLLQSDGLTNHEVSTWTEEGTQEFEALQRVKEQLGWKDE